MPILICYDGSPSAKEAVTVAGATLAGNTVTLLHVWEPPLAVLADSFGDVGTIAAPSVAELDRICADRGAAILAEGEALARDKGIQVTARLERDHQSVWRTILDVADEVGSELIVIGTRGRTAMESHLLGSVSGAVAHHAALPVLLVPGPSRSRRTGARLGAERLYRAVDGTVSDGRGPGGDHVAAVAGARPGLRDERDSGAAAQRPLPQP